MARWLKVAGGVVVGLGLAAAGVAGAAYLYAGSAAEARLSRTFPEVQGKDVPIPFPLTEAEIDALRAERRAAIVAEKGEEALVGPDGAEIDVLDGVDLDAIAMERAAARGEKLAKHTFGCPECHGEDGAGKLVADAQPVWTWYAPNITRGGRTADYAPRDWDRLLRHGIKPDGTPATMPAVDYAGLADRDLSDLAAWVMSLPPSDVEQPPTVLGPVGKALIGFGQIPLSAEEIDHHADHPVLPPEPGATVERGAYLARTCVGCHRADYSGGPIAQGPPDWPPAANLTPHDGGIGAWSEQDWLAFWKTGKRPDGTEVSPVMPWQNIAQMGDDELLAIFRYLKTVEPRPTGQ